MIELEQSKYLIFVIESFCQERKRIGQLAIASRRLSGANFFCHQSFTRSERRRSSKETWQAVKQETVWIREFERKKVPVVRLNSDYSEYDKQFSSSQFESIKLWNAGAWNAFHLFWSMQKKNVCCMQMLMNIEFAHAELILRLLFLDFFFFAFFYTLIVLSDSEFLNDLRSLYSSDAFDQKLIFVLSLTKRILLLGRCIESKSVC